MHALVVTVGEHACLISAVFFSVFLVCNLFVCVCACVDSKRLRA